VGVLMLPFGFDAFCWWLMGEGISWMIDVAVWVASLPGAVGRMAAFGTGPLLLGSFGLVVLCLLRSPLRVVGIGLFALATVWAARTPQPDVLVAADGTSFAVRQADGRLAAIRTGSDSFAIRQWLAADGDARAHDDPAVSAGIACDQAGCIGRLPDGRPVALARNIEAFEEDCRRAAVVASAREAPPGCAALLIDRNVLRRTGAVSLRRVGEGFEVTAARPAGYDRPWARALANDDASGAPATPRTPAPDATPRPEDLEPGD
jgi:competence protein ComEC